MTCFEADPAKDVQSHRSHRRHGMVVASVQFAFADPQRVIAEDVSPSGRERRY